jgi:L-arabinose isomerase
MGESGRAAPVGRDLENVKMSERLQAKIGLLPTGHHYYWEQFPRLKAMGLSMYGRLRELLDPHGEIVAPELVDTPQKAAAAGEMFRRAGVDLLLIFPFGYTPSMDMLPAVQGLDVPIRLLNAHEDRSYDYAAADTTDYLHHEGVCCIPEFAGALRSQGRRFTVRTGPLDDARLQAELGADFAGVAAARSFRQLNVGLIGQVYPGMTDMPIDEHRLLRVTGRMLARPEVEEIEEAYRRVTDDQLEEMYTEFRRVYAVDATVTNEHMRFSAQLAVAFDEVVRRHDIDAFGYYWWGEQELITQLRAQSGLAVSRLAARGRPGVTEGDVKTAMAMKLLDLLGAGGMFVEFFAMDFDENSFLMGHDGPANVGMAAGQPRLMHLEVHHGKSGHGLGIDFDMRSGPVTMLNLTQFDAGDTFKLIYTIGEISGGPTLSIGNPNARVKIARPLHEFMDAWCQEGPSHHIAMGYGDQTQALETFAEAMGFPIVRI